MYGFILREAVLFAAAVLLVQPSRRCLPLQMRLPCREYALFDLYRVHRVHHLLLLTQWHIFIVACRRRAAIFFIFEVIHLCRRLLPVCMPMSLVVVGFPHLLNVFKKEVSKDDLADISFILQLEQVS